MKDGDYSTDFYTDKIIEYIDHDKDDEMLMEWSTFSKKIKVQLPNQLEINHKK